MLDYEVFDHWDTPEPSAEELAEIDAAIAAAQRRADSTRRPDAPADAWADNFAVRRAVDVVGPPDGTGTWQARFAAHLFGITDAIGERVDPDEVDGLLHIASVVRRSLQDADPNKPPSAGLRFAQSNPVGSARLLLQHMDLEHCAWLLGVTEDRLVEYLWPADLAVRLRAATTEWMDGRPLTEASAICDVDARTIGSWIKIHGLERPFLVGSGKRQMSAACRRRVLALADADLSCAEIREIVTAEFPEIASFSQSAVRRAVTKRRKRHAELVAA